MLTFENARKIGLNACIDKIGRNFVMANKDAIAVAYGDSEEGVFCFVGVDTAYVSRNCADTLVLDSTSKFQYRVSCNVRLADGVTDFIECIAPVLCH